MSEKEPLSKAIEEVRDIKHYGVLGMRWGVRRPVGPDGLVTGSVKSAARQMKNLKNVRNKELKKLTNEELKSRADRLTKENRMKQLSRSKEDKKAYKSRDRLSDSELNDKVNRLQLEENLRRESIKSNKSEIDAINSLLKDVSKEAMKSINDHQFSENKTTDFMIKQLVKRSTKKIRDGKAIPNS